MITYKNNTNTLSHSQKMKRKVLDNESEDVLKRIKLNNELLEKQNEIIEFEKLNAKRFNDGFLLYLKDKMKENLKKMGKRKKK